MKVRHPYAKNEVREVPDNDVEQWLEAAADQGQQPEKEKHR
jgi:hypothetical protein